MRDETYIDELLEDGLEVFQGTVVERIDGFGALGWN